MKKENNYKFTISQSIQVKTNQMAACKFYTNTSYFEIKIMKFLVTFEINFNGKLSKTNL